MPSRTVYFPDELHSKITARTDDADNYSTVVQELVRAGLEGDHE